LKGRKISSGYRTFEIIDLDRLISELSNALVLWGEGGTSQITTEIVVGNLFKSIMKALIQLATVWSGVTKVNPGTHLRRIQEELITWERKIRAAAPALNRPLSQRTIADTLVSILRSHVFNAPHTTVAERVSGLLKLMDVKMSAETIRKKIYR